MKPCVMKGCNGPVGLQYALPNFDVLQCERCKMLYQDPFPDSEKLREMYDSPDYVESGYFTATETGPAKERPEVEIYRSGLKCLADQHPAVNSTGRGSLLDVGCGSGLFLQMARDDGWQVEGVEISSHHAERARREKGLTVHEGEFDRMEIEGAAFDAITLWDLLEHVVRPEDTLERARSLLSPGGSLLVFTINSASLLNQLAHAGHRLTRGLISRPIELLYDAHHCFYFTEQTLANLVSRSGFEILERYNYRAHLNRWLIEPAPAWMRAGTEVVDWLSIPLNRQYRQAILCRPC